MTPYHTTLKVATIFAVLLFTLSCSLETSSRKAETGHSKTAESTYLEAENLVDYIVQELMKLPGTPPGISLAISHNDDIIYVKGFGYANLKTKEVVTPETQFRAGSLSRIITITTLAKLIENGTLHFNDTVQKLLPEYTKKAYSFTLKQLASGLSGMPGYTDRDRFAKSSYQNVDEALQVFSHVPLTHKPGEKYQFSMHAFTLLSKIMKKASNKNFPTLLTEDLFSPLAMHSTQLEDLKNRPEQMTDLFELNREGIHKGFFSKIDTLKDYSYSWAGSGMISTPSDMLKLANAYSTGFISKEIQDEIFEIQTLNSGDTIRQSIGWDKNWDMGNRKVFEQDGAAEGTRSIVSVFPDQKLSIAFMTNALRLRAIEETVHTLAIPFLTPPAPKKQPQGVFKLEIFEDVRAKWVQRNGYVVLNGESDRLVIDSGTKNEERYRLVYLNRENKYALIHPDGILYAEINFDEDAKLTGKVMYYRGPNLHKTTTEPPYLRFRSRKEKDDKR